MNDPQAADSTLHHNPPPCQELLIASSAYQNGAVKIAHPQQHAEDDTAIGGGLSFS
jgi:hypothetical protein